MEKRLLTREMVESVLAHPEKRMPDPFDPQLEHCWGKVPALANRTLRVIDSPRRVITAHLDRLATKKP